MNTRFLPYWTLLLAVASTCLIVETPLARADERDAVHHFASLPDGLRFPEGIAANPKTREIIVGTFDSERSNRLLRFASNGRLLAQRDFGATALLGLAFHAPSGKVYIANFGASKIQRIASAFDGTTAIEDVGDIPILAGPPLPRTVANPDGSSDTIMFGSNFFPGPNGLVFDKSGTRLYISDSFQGAIFRLDDPTTCAPTCFMSTIARDPLLATAGFPPFGANGVALSEDETALFIANTGDDRVLKFDFLKSVVTVFAESINGADGLVFDSRGRLWVAANQNDELVALNANGRVVARVGDFKGIHRNGTPEGLLFPASVVILEDEMFVTNTALPLTPAIGDEPEEDVTRYTVSRIKLRRH
jgi:DNA-binding beta-propeller fold protein YncE